MDDPKDKDETFLRLFSFHWQWIFLFAVLTVFSGFALWSLQSMTQRAEERFQLEALTNCKVLEVAIADTVSQYGGYEGVQKRINALIEKDHRIARLSFIALARDNTYRHVASSLSTRIGQPAHPEDLEAIASGEVIMLEEDYKVVGALDITYPVRDENGNILGLIGYTVKRGQASREPVILVVVALLVILSLLAYFIYLLRRSFMEIRGHKKAARILQDSDRIKSHFISTAAHELRTPLSSITGYAELLLKPELSGSIDQTTRKDFLEEIYAKSQALNTIIDDLLDLSRIESGLPIPLERQPCDIAEIIRKEVDHFRIHAPNNRYELSLVPTRDAEIWVDRNKIVQVLENLLGNAIKFSPDDDTIRISGEKWAEGYRLVVADNGIGMTPEQVEQIFDKFYRADYTNTAISGLGLGMNIVQQIVHAHGGTIHVTSKPGQGTTVTVDLPVRQPPSQENRP